MTSRLPLILIALFSLIQGCQRFEKHFDAVGALCGVDPSSFNAEGRIIKFEDPQGEELSSATLLTTRSRFLSHSRGVQNLEISSRGCVRTAAESGVIQAFSSAQGWSLAHEPNDSSEQKLLRLAMQPSPHVSAELQCPQQGYFAHETLTFPLRWAGDGPLHAARFELTAVDEKQQKPFVFFEKPYGMHLNDLPHSLTTDSLPEGQYQLRLSFQVSMEGWDIPGSIPTRVESCPLTILHRRPEVGGLEGYGLGQRVAVFAKGAILPWKAPSPQSDLHYCREARGHDLDDIPSTESSMDCQPRGACRESGNFHKTGAITAEDLGVFDYYGFAEDRAGNRSALSCQTVAVTEQKPGLQLLWSEDEWNKPSSQMRVPRPTARLRIVGRHPQLEDGSLTARFQCKADFVREDQSLLTGRSVLCTSGRCKKKNLEFYTDCDADLQVELFELWPHIKAEGGRLRIFVKADDQAGHVHEEMTSIGIQPQRWQPLRLSTASDITDNTRQMLQDHQRRIFVVRGHDISRWDEDAQAWQLVAVPAEAIGGQMSQIWLSQEGELHAQWGVWRMESFRIDFYLFKWVDSGWQKVTPLDPQNAVECLRPQSFHRGGFWCATDKSMAIHQNGQWSFIPWPAERDRCHTLPQTQALVRDQQQNLWLSCNSSLFRSASGQNTWTLVDHSLPLLKIGVDAQERLWVVRGRSGQTMSIEVTTTQGTQTLPIPASLQGIDLGAEDFVIGPASEIIMGDSYWDDSRNSWQMFPYLTARRAEQRMVPHFLTSGKLYWETHQGFMLWDGQGLRHWDLRVQGILFGRVGFHLAEDEKDRPMILASPAGIDAVP